MSEEAAELQGEDLPENTVEGAIEEESPPSEESVDSQDDAPEEPKPKAKGVQKRIDELTELRRSAEKDRDYWRDLAISKKEEPKAPEPKPAAEPLGRPVLDDFASYDEFSEALVDWKIEQREKASAERKAVEQQGITRQERETAFQQRVAKVEATHPDWDEVVRGMPLLNANTYEAAQVSDKGPEILYYLGQNPEEAAQIYRMDAVQSALAIGRLEVKLSRPTKTQTGAPDPIEPVHGGGGPQTVDPDKMNMDQWLKWRNQQLKGR